MDTVTQTATALIPWAFILGFFGLLVRVRLAGDPALWKRVENLEAALSKQACDFKVEMALERAECDKKIKALEGEVRQLKQREQSMYSLADRPLAGPLASSFHPSLSDEDADLIGRLRAVPSKRTEKE